MSGTDFFRAAVPATAIDPVSLARRDLVGKLPKRFYKLAHAGPHESGHALLLDGKLAHTPGRAPIILPAAPLAAALADEWNAQSDVIDPSAMPLTRLVNSALDGVARNPADVGAELVKYAGSDLLCYRAGEPDILVAEQAQAWDPVLAWARDDLGARFVLAEGIIHATQPDHAIAAIAEVVEELPQPFGLAAVSSMTTLSGSVLLALAVARGRLDAAQAWAAAHVDESYQERFWGTDFEAQQRRERRWLEMQSAALVLASLNA